MASLSAILAASPSPPAARRRGGIRALAAFPLPGLGLLVAADGFGCAAGRFAVTRFWGILAATLLLLAIALLYATLRPRPAIAGMAGHAALWVGFSAAGAVLTYLAATADLPLRDGWLRAADAALGFDWARPAGWVGRHGFADAVLRLAYFSLLPQIALSIALHARARPERNREMLGAAMLALVPTVALSLLLPALGPGAAPGAPPTADLAYLAPLLALRHGALHVFALPVMQGIVTFPSYHAALAVSIAASHRGTRAFRGFVVVEALVLAATPPIGGHYLSDVLAGLAIALPSVLLAARRSRPAAAAPARGGG